MKIYSCPIDIKPQFGGTPLVGFRNSPTPDAFRQIAALAGKALAKGAIV
jgi:hypothetical protein